MIMRLSVAFQARAKVRPSLIDVTNVAAIVAEPVMVDTAGCAEAGFLRNQQRAAATRTFRPAETFG